MRRCAETFVRSAAKAREVGAQRTKSGLRRFRVVAKVLDDGGRVRGLAPARKIETPDGDVRSSVASKRRVQIAEQR